ncbi:serine/threonine protein kinase [Bacilli bacterium PM5-3]|nr:serine/threonine protein kinase [Bacilli bacterium PM5-3]
MVNNNTGYLLNNRYRLIDQIGEGGMANVYLGKDTILNRSVAIKVLRGDLSHDETFVKRFQREALAATALEHPNLVQVYDVGEEQGYHYIVMEYIEGKTLKQLIKQHGPLSVGETIDVMEQLVSAVEHAHSRRVIHRDIKPQNVIVRNDGTVKLTDFGIAVAQNAAQLTQTNSIMGSVHYLAPELAKGQTASYQSDIYSLGILMYELLAGQVPFAGESAVNIALMHMEDKMPSIRQVVGPDVNQAIENIIIKATTKNRSYRYQSAHEMLVDLVDCQYRNNEAVYEVEDDYVEEVNNDTTTIYDRDELNAKSKKKMPRKKKMIIIGAIVAAVLALAVAAYIIFGGGSGVTMPDLVEKTKDEVETILVEKKITEDEGFKINYKTAENPDVEEGKVIETDPIAGAKLKKKATITIVISSGEIAKVPDLTSMSEDDAKAELKRAGLEVKIVYSQTDDKNKEYKVMSTNPVAGTEVQKGSTVTIEIGTPEKITVANVIKLTYKSAYDTLLNLGLSPSTSNCSEGDTVIKQSVAPGKEVEKGKKVKLTCEIKKDPSTPAPPDSTTPDASSNKYD